ncbi:MAG TPA: ATP-grasp domain-containing protein [Bacteroidota bacterium]|nr:ATP-grasp domain-containing protein [Bacteroidota bacterium]
MRKKVSVAIVHNEPVTDVDTKRKFISERGELQEGRSVSPAHVDTMVDLSEVGVLEEREDIARALNALGYRASIFNVDEDISRLVNFLKEEQPDLIFNLCESVANKATHEMHVAGIYELLGIPYTGSNAFTLGIALNKVLVKEMLYCNGLPTPRFQLFSSPVRIALDESMAYPLIVKPSREDASIGIEPGSIVANMTELRKRVRHVIEEYDQPALVEEYIDGRELNVAIMGNRKPVVFPISEIDMSTLPKRYPRIITYNAKWMKGTEEYEHTKGVCPALLPPALETQIKEMALCAYRLLGCRDYARVDFRLSKDHQPYILEVNPNPDISDDAGFARSAAAHGYQFEELVGKIVECALERMP